jgi:DNA-binding transcriptional LysR family regulator
MVAVCIHRKTRRSVARDAIAKIAGMDNTLLGRIWRHGRSVGPFAVDQKLHRNIPFVAIPHKRQIAFPVADGHSRFTQMEFAEMHSGLDWNDLRIVLAIAREGSLSGAARRLRVTHSTVFRRLAVIERALGVRLFERFPDGYAATPAGEAAASLAQHLADEIGALERRLSGQDMRPSGSIRIATADTIWPLVNAHLPAFRAAFPDIVPEVAISDAMANLTRREADIAIRPIPGPPENLIGRRIADIAHAVYASPKYLARKDTGDGHARYWIGLEDAVAPTVIGRWLRRHVRPDEMVLTVNALPALRDAACAGMGLVLLPCYMGDSDDRLRRVDGVPADTPRSALWLLTHNDLRRTARVRAAMDFFAEAFLRNRALLEGERPIAKAAARMSTA